MKSWTFTDSGLPFGWYSRPPLRKSPIDSFFLVSTEMTGSRSCRRCEACRLMNSNWAFRSGFDERPSKDFWFAWRLNPNCSSRRATVRAPTGCPWAVNSLARRSVLLLVQRSGDIGSSRVAGATSRSRAGSSSGSLASARLRPPPGRRIRPGPTSTLDAASPSSSKPRWTVRRATPVARATASMPPRPATLASAAASTRRVRSSRRCSTCLKREETATMSMIRHHGTMGV